VFIGGRANSAWQEATVQDGTITEILNRARLGDRDAASELLPLVYRELRQIASGYLTAERANHTLQPTALVHEAYIRLIGRNGDWKNRAHFLAASATAMRRVLVDHARGRRAAKRGGGATLVSLNSGMGDIIRQDVQVLELNELLEQLANLSERMAKIVELRFFAGMTIPEAAEALGVSTTVVDDDWAMARAWLASQIRKDADS
jgi:RNA polymerase sigma factor (TIGR02999 family)